MIAKILSASMLLASTASAAPVIGGPDAYGCFPAAGYSWCHVLGECIRPWETKCEPGAQTDLGDARDLATVAEPQRRLQTDLGDAQDLQTDLGDARDLATVAEPQRRLQLIIDSHPGCPTMDGEVLEAVKAFASKLGFSKQQLMKQVEIGVSPGSAPIPSSYTFTDSDYDALSAIICHGDIARLNLQHARITDKGLSKLSLAVTSAGTNTLKGLYLQGNRISEQGFLNFLDKVKGTPKELQLEAVGFGGNTFSQHKCERMKRECLHGNDFRNPKNEGVVAHISCLAPLGD